MPKLLHFLEANLFEQKSLISIFEPNSRKIYSKEKYNPP